MNKTTIKIALFIALCTLASGISVFAQTNTNIKYRYNNIKPKQPTLTKSMMPAVIEYKKGNYLGAMVDLRKITEKEPNNIYAKYYLALCCSQLGYKNEAQSLYNEVISANTNYALTYYSKKALSCIDNPDNDACLPPKKVTAPEFNLSDTTAENADDMTKFIQSGVKIHPAALDKITKEKMERQMQAEIYKKEHEQDVKDSIDGAKKSDASTPTNEEIASALNTLSKIGINPFNMQNPYTLANSPMNSYSRFDFDGFNNPAANMMLLNNNKNAAQMLMYAQMAQQNNLLY